jgi:hypothetical protein
VYKTINYLATQRYLINSIVRSVLLTQYCSGDKMEKNEIGWACSACGGEERRIQGFGGETGGKEITGET